ncbi:MAG: TadE/TadG family type IV pilus assembly protein [Acidocella sp.]|nr:TadE/TadG family type IV pilus assembly protein [Acidocella sp.]
MSGPIKTTFLGARGIIPSRRAATAVEFAIIGAVFFLFIFGIFVISIDQFWQMTLDDAVRATTRQVQIGKVVNGAEFVTAVCGEFGIAAPYCTNTLQYSVQSASTFGGLTPAILSSSGTLTPASTFNVTPTTAPAAATQSQPAVIGAPQFLLVQVAYLLPFKILIAPGGVATENGTPSLYSAVATVMEP